MTRLELATEPVAVYADQIGTPSLGDHSYLVVVGDRAVVIDPQRDVERFEKALAQSGASLAGVFETHIHNDYVSGGPALARRHGADYVLPADSGGRMEHTALAADEIYAVGLWRLRAIHTPGHTPHHMSYALEGPDGVAAVFTGGSMLVGAVGRSDLLGEELTIPLARLQYRSVNHLATVLPAPVVVGPTHGSGSFCSASDVADTTSTIGRERRQNPAVTAPDEDAFVAGQLADYRLYPSYYAHMGPANAAGMDEIVTDPLPRPTLDDLADGGGRHRIVDLRPAAEFAADHLPGSINVPFSNDSATYIGWIFEWNDPVVLVADSAADVDEVRLQLARIGYDEVAGAVTSGLTEWRAAGRPTRSYRLADFAQLAAVDPPHVLDTRDPREAAAGMVPGAVNIHTSQIEVQLAEIPEGEVWLYCGSGYRAAIAASLLERHGRTPVLVADDFSNAGTAAEPAAAH